MPPCWSCRRPKASSRRPSSICRSSTCSASIAASSRLTKADLADDDQILERMAEVETLLATTSLKGAEIVPVSALTGQGVDELKAKLLALGESGKGATGFARLAVDRCFVLTGAGVVVTGTVHAGEIRVDDRLLLTPSGLEARVRSLHAQNRAGRGRPRRRALRAQPHRAAAVEGRDPRAATGW